MLWSGLVSWVGASYRVNLIVPFPLGLTCPRKIGYDCDNIKIEELLLGNTGTQGNFVRNIGGQLNF